MTSAYALPQEAPRAAIYCRISQDREGQALGVERQREACEELALRLGWETSPFRVYIDNDVSASTLTRRKRPEYQRLLQDIDSGRVTALAAYSTSRITRRPREFLDILDRVKERGLMVQTVASGSVDLSTAAGRMIAWTLAGFDNMEVEQLSERVKAQKAQARASGRPMGGPRAFGWEKRYAEPHPVEGPLVKAAARAVLAGASLRSIAAEWEAAVGTAPQGGRMSPGVVRKVLLNPRHVPGLIPEDTASALRALLTDPARRRTERAHPIHLLTGIAVCGRCGATVHSAGESERGRLYRCSASHHLSRKAETIDTYVSTEVLAALAARGAVPGREAQDAAVLEATERARAARASLDGLAALFTSGTLTAGEIQAEATRLRAELAEAEAVLAQDAGTAALDDAPADADALREWWDGLSPERRRAVLLALNPYIILRPWKTGGTGAFDPRSVTILWSPMDAERARKAITQGGPH